MDDPYRLVACSFHDHLESWAVRRTVLRVVWRDGDETREAVTTLDDVFAADGADWVRLATGDIIRADRLMAVGPSG